MDGRSNGNAKKREEAMREYYKPVEDLQEALFEDIEDWREEWQSMPEFDQKAQAPYAAIIVRFSNKEDLLDFSKRIGQELTERTKSIWHPKRALHIQPGYIYTDEGKE